MTRAELASATATACRHGIVRERARCAECERPAPGEGGRARMTTPQTNLGGLGGGSVWGSGG